MLQASSICRKLALAALALLGQPGTELVLSDSAPLDSKLLTSWAPLLHQLALSEATLAVPGLASFVHEAAQLETLRVTSSWHDAAAELGQLFRTGGFSSITKLVYKGGKCPTSFPSGLQHLEVDFYGWGLQQSPANHLNRALKKAGVALQSLSIGLQDNPVLRSTQVLPPLQDLHIQLTLSSSKTLDLGWLRRQQTSRLRLAITIGSVAPAMHARAVLLQQSLQLHELRLVFCCPFTSEVQRAWHPLQLQGVLHLSLYFFPSSEHKLSLMPSAPQLHIRVEQVLACRPVWLHWDAVTSRPGSVRMTLQALDPGCVLAVSGCSGQVPFQASIQPWQFCVHGNVSVAGLPPSQPCTGATYLLQNRAAIAAGWSEDM